MLYEFVDEFKKIKIGEKVKIKNRCLCSKSQVHPSSVSKNYVRWIFQMYIDLNSNKFTVKDIQDIGEDNAMITVHEVEGSLEYLQVEPFLFKGTVRVLNC